VGMLAREPLDRRRHDFTRELVRVHTQKWARIQLRFHPMLLRRRRPFGTAAVAP
jgi:hypothetical protein